MTESEYFSALRDLLASNICMPPSVAGNHYAISETGQQEFILSTRNLRSHKAIQLEKLRPLDWPCFKHPHKFAHKRCDCIVVRWDGAHQAPVFVLVELKSSQPGGARKQLAASLAFCHFVHNMVCVGFSMAPKARFGAVTVLNMPFVLKALSVPTLPPWSAPKLHAECEHLQYQRGHGILPLAAVIAAIR
jgi:hypothetical protein